MINTNKKVYVFSAIVVLTVILIGAFLLFRNYKQSESESGGAFVAQNLRDYKGNYIYGAAMNLAWNDLNDNILHEKLKLNTNNEAALKLVDEFNNASFTKNDLDEASYYIKSGYGQKTVDEINKESRKKFPDKSFEDLQIILGGNDIIAYAYFLKEVEYSTQFKKYDVDFKGEKVQGFIADDSEQKNNIQILKYWDDDKFIIGLRLKDDSDELFLAKGFDSESENAKNVIDEINKYNKNNLEIIGDQDVFKMPELHLDYEYDFNDLIGIPLANIGFTNYSIGRMFEKIKFDMDYKGARVENEAVITMEFSGYISNVSKPKYFILNKPFWVVMKRKDSQNPIFILNVNNTELMKNSLIKERK